MRNFLYLFAVIVTLCSCERMPLNTMDKEEGYVSKSGNLILKLSPYEQHAMTRTAVNISELCTRFNVSIFDVEGDKAASAAQSVGDDDFGTIALSLAEGTYTLIAIGHNKDKSVPISATNKIEFSGGPSDVFCYYGVIEVTEEPQELNVSMSRAVAMFKLTITDEAMPEGVTQLKFSVTGGSQNLDPSTGYGCTKSTQKSVFTVDASHKEFEIYTFPRQDSNTLDVVVSALAADETEIMKREFEDVPIAVNNITSYRGELFSNVSSVTRSAYTFTADPEWNATNNYDF